MIPSCSLIATDSGASGGGGGATVVLTDRTVSDGVTDGSTATATFEISSDATVRDQDNTLLETWLTGGAVGDYQVRATLNSGTSPSGSAVGSWLACSSSRSWSISDSPGGAQTECELTVEIRDAASPNTVRATATITITAIATNEGGGG